MFEIVIVASDNRKPIITEHLKNTPHRISITPNYELPVNFKPKVVGLVENHLGAYRCFRGHQDALKISIAEDVLIFEDDADPNTSNWMDIISHPLICKNYQDYEMISFHGRQHNLVDFEPSLIPGYVRPKKDTWIVAALAYMVNRKCIKKLLSYEYDGLPWDLLLYRTLSYCLLENSCFNHNRSKGSLIDV